MNKNKSALIAALALGCLAAFNPLAQATPAVTPPNEAAKAPVQTPGRRAASQDRMTQMDIALTFTEEQKAKLKPVFQEETKKLTALRQDQSGARDDRMAKIQEIRDATDKVVVKLLTPEQKKKWDALMEKAKVQSASQPARPAPASPAPARPAPTQ